LFDAVELVVFRLAEVVPAALYDYVAGGTGAAPPARVLEVDAVVQTDVEDRTLQAMLRVRRGGGVILERHAERENGNLMRHLPS
jgi:hypothetical protein